MIFLTWFLFAVHLFFTVKLGFVQKDVFKGIRYSFQNDCQGSGIGTYRAFAAALGTTIGPGNVVGVAVAISLGGSGAVLWMWLSGVVAMATKYAESYLCVKYKTTCGGTMVLLSQNGKGILAFIWSVFCAAAGLFMGAAVPSNSLSASLNAPEWIVGFFLALLTLVTVSFGFLGIASVSGLLVPVMSLAFTAFCLLGVFMNIELLPSAIADMLKNAFLPSSFAGGGVGLAIKHGVTRGLYSNESGLGTGGVLAAEAGEKDAHKSALASMTTTFWDTVVMCAITGVMFITCGAEKGMSVTDILDISFSILPFGKVFLGISMSVFVFATIIGWYYIAKRVIGYYTKKSGFYDVLYILMVFVGSVAGTDFIWKISDVINICLLLPSLYVILYMRSKIGLYISNK